MTAPTLAPLPAGASDDLVYALYMEGLKQTPADQRSTCGIHVNWRDRCAHLHEAGVR